MARLTISSEPLPPLHAAPHSEWDFSQEMLPSRTHRGHSGVDSTTLQPYQECEKGCAPGGERGTKLRAQRTIGCLTTVCLRCKRDISKIDRARPGVFHVSGECQYPLSRLQQEEEMSRDSLSAVSAECCCSGNRTVLVFVTTVTDVLSSNSTVHGHMARTDVRTSALYNAPWFYFPLPFQFGTPTISSSGFTAMLIITIVNIIQVPGFYSATASVVELPPPPAHALNRGIAVDGISSAISGMLGGVYSSILYIQSLGVVTVTKVASRSVFVTAALILMIGGVVGKVGAVFTIIPDPVVGGVNFVAVGTVTAVGVSMSNAVDLSSSRNLLILGISLSLGLLLPDWMAANENSINTGNEVLDQLLEVLLVTPMFVTMFSGCVLDNLAPGTQEERGMAKRNLEATRDTQETTDDPYRLPYISTYMDKLRCCSYFPASPTFKQVLVTCNKKEETI